VMSRQQSNTKRILVVGGNGFIGSAIAEEAVNRGHNVTSLSRRGTPPSHLQQQKQGWHTQVNWKSGDIGTSDGSAAWQQSILPQVDAVVSCVGGFGSNEKMVRINGDMNANLAKEASKYRNIQKFVYVSAQPYAIPRLIIPGYVEGKEKAENAVKSLFFPNNKGVILRPSFVYGTRYTQLPVLQSNTPLPLWLVGLPVEKLLRIQPFTALHKYAPVNVKDVAKAAVDAATLPNVTGVLTVDDIYNQAHNTSS